MKKKQLLTVTCLFIVSFNLFSQDTARVFLKDKSVIEGIILKVSDHNIEIDPVGKKPFLIINRSDAEVIIYSDNTVVNLNQPARENPSSRKDPFMASKTVEYTIETRHLSEPLTSFSRFKTQLLDHKYVFRDTVNNRTVIVRTDGGFRYHRYVDTGFLGARHGLTIRRMTLKCTLEMDGYTDSHVFIHANDSKDHRHILKGGYIKGKEVLEADSNVPLGDYTVGYEMGLLTMNHLYFTISIKSRQ